MAGIQVNRILGDLEASMPLQRLAGVGIDVKAREITAGDVQANLVPSFENIGSWIEGYDEWIRLARLQQRRLLQRVAIAGTNNRVADIELEARRIVAVGRIHIDQLSREVCVYC